MSQAALDLIGNIGWTLVHFTWQGLVLGLATAVALALMRDARPEQRYTVACTALFLCFAWPAYEWFQRLTLGPVSEAGASFGQTLSLAPVQASLAAALQDKLPWIVGLWASCAAVLTLRMACGMLWVSRIATHHQSHPLWQARITQMADEWGISRRVRLRLVDKLAGPVTAGWLRPVIMLPTALATGMPPELLEALLAHEMAHIRRFDYLVNLGQNVVETLLFYHPAVWWISGRIRIERELIADDLAAARLEAPRTLALALSELEKMRFAESALVLAANGGDLSSRIRRLLRPHPCRQDWKAALPIVALALACAALAAQARPGGSTGPTHKAILDFKSCAKPRYPAESLRAAHTGTVTLEFLVTEDGQVADSLVVLSSGHAALDSAARDAIALCRFSPAMQNGQAVPSRPRVQYRWSLG